MKLSCAGRTYINQGNWPLLRNVPSTSSNVLDVGCGAGDNAALLKRAKPNVKIFGITLSRQEQALSIPYMEECVIADIEEGVPRSLENIGFDVVIFSHVLEHTRNPSEVVAAFARVLNRGGIVLIAVPNVLAWKQRLRFCIGRFEYAQTGIMDSTHLRFFTYKTASQYLLGDAAELKLVKQSVTGAVPLWIARRYLLPQSATRALDSLGCRLMPNLFGDQVILVAQVSAEPR